MAHVGQELALGPVGGLGISGEFARRGQRLLELLVGRRQDALHRFAIGQIGEDHDGAEPVIVETAQCRGRQKIDEPTVRTRVPQFEDSGRVCTAALFPERDNLRHSLRRDDDREIGADQMIGCRAQHRRPGRVDVFTCAIRAEDHHALAKRVEDKLGEIAFSADLVLQGLARCNVFDQADDLPHGAIRIALEDQASAAQPAPGPIRGPQPILVFEDLAIG